MEFFELRADANHFANLGFAEERDSEIIYDFDGRSLVSGWRPLSVEVLDDDLPLGDILSFHTHIPVLTEGAVIALESLIKDSCEVLPLSCPSLICFALNVTEMVDALDEARSEIIYFSTGKILHLKRACFDYSKLNDIDIFKLPQTPLGKVFVSSRFVDRVRSTGLNGFLFEPHSPVGRGESF